MEQTMKTVIGSGGPVSGDMSRKSVSDQWDINLQMKSYLKEKLVP
jgi:hypothetical protein